MRCVQDQFGGVFWWFAHPFGVLSAEYTLSTVLLLSLTGIFTASGNLLLLTGGGAGTNSISFYIFQQVYGQAEDSTTFNLGSAIGMFFTLLTIPIVFTVRHFTNRVEDVQY